ncbi:type II toxin-antitoxin system death-on-curing family toxin [Methylobacterium terrae]|uniref:type II toxin-antitoxin system death-on-curing family toxin n=1 Tax=Methylobacterium terrae TaxID=2202827 RepID=UPI0013A5526C|nr:type II toxin-antitoxin system death-on-curing family toxin [Methylobacterium terrae]
MGATGEPVPVHDQGKIDGALARPPNLLLHEGEDDVLTLAVSLLIAIAKPHAFAQGNKRTAFFAMGTFLRANGYDLGLPDLDSLRWDRHGSRRWRDRAAGPGGCPGSLRHSP